jgi:secretion/DNA translocation related TadE-like protein
VTIWTAALTGLIWLACSGALLYGAAVTGRHRVETAADLAALAAAAHVPDGEPGACAEAASIAARNGGTLRACRVAGADVEVAVSAPIRLGRFGVRTATALARAGPVAG